MLAVVNRLGEQLPQGHLGEVCQEPLGSGQRRTEPSHSSLFLPHTSGPNATEAQSQSRCPNNAEQMDEEWKKASYREYVGFRKFPQCLKFPKGNDFLLAPICLISFLLISKTGGVLEKSSGLLSTGNSVKSLPLRLWERWRDTGGYTGTGGFGKEATNRREKAKFGINMEEQGQNGNSQHLEHKRKLPWLRPRQVTHVFGCPTAPGWLAWLCWPGTALTSEIK